MYIFIYTSQGCEIWQMPGSHGFVRLLPQLSICALVCVSAEILRCQLYSSFIHQIE